MQKNRLRENERQHGYKYACMHIGLHKYIRPYTCIHTYIRTYTHIHIHTLIHAYMYRDIHSYMYVRVYVSVYSDEHWKENGEKGVSDKEERQISLSLSFA